MEKKRRHTLWKEMNGARAERRRGAFHHCNAVVCYVLFAVQSKGDVSSEYAQRRKKKKKIFGRLGHLWWTASRWGTAPRRSSDRCRRRAARALFRPPESELDLSAKEEDGGFWFGFFSNRRQNISNLFVCLECGETPWNTQKNEIYTCVYVYIYTCIHTVYPVYIYIQYMYVYCLQCML